MNTPQKTIQNDLNEGLKIGYICFLNDFPMQFVDTDEGLKAAYQDADKHSWTKEELEAYDYAAMRQQDERGKIEKAKQRRTERNKTNMILKLYSKDKALEEIAVLLDISLD